MRKLIALLLSLTVMILVSCRKDTYAPVPTLDLNTPVSFKADIMPVFVTHCYGSGCHDKGIPPDLTAANAYDQLTLLGYVDTTDAEGSKLYARMVSTSSPMPPAGVLSGDITNKILAWIKQGAQNN